jgi:hypothetical protein
VRRGLLIALAVAIVVAGVAVCVLAFPTRYGCNDGAGTFTTSAAVAESACGSTATRFVTDSAVVADQRVVARAAVAVVAVAALVLLFRLAGRSSGEPELPDTWRPYG